MVRAIEEGKRKKRVMTKHVTNVIFVTIDYTLNLHMMPFI